MDRILSVYCINSNKNPRDSFLLTGHLYEPRYTFLVEYPTPGPRYLYEACFYLDKYSSFEINELPGGKMYSDHDMFYRDTRYTVETVATKC